MLRRTICIAIVSVLVFVTGCAPANKPPAGGSPWAASHQATGEAVALAPPTVRASTASPAPLPTSTPRPLPSATLRPPATAIPPPVPIESPATAVPPAATSLPEAALPPGLVTSSGCGNMGAVRLSRVYWGEESPPIPSPDGVWVARTFNPDGDARLVVTHQDSADQVVIAAPQWGIPLGMPFWSPPTDASGDQPRVALANVTLSQPGGGSIYVVSAGDSTLTHVADYLGFHDDLAWSPDGAWLAFTSAATVSGSGSGMQVRDYQVLVVPADGSAEPVVVGPGCNPHWPAGTSEIVAFHVVPAQARPGDSVSLSWQARGDSAVLCPKAEGLFTAADCWPAPVSGFTLFLIPAEAEGLPGIDLVLEVQTLAPPATATARVWLTLE